MYYIFLDLNSQVIGWKNHGPDGVKVNTLPLDYYNYKYVDGEYIRNLLPQLELQELLSQYVSRELFNAIKLLNQSLIDCILLMSLIIYA